MRCLIVIPAYNEAGSIENMVGELVRKTAVFDDAYDYIIINDGSSDGTGAILDENCFNHIDLPINLGIGGAMQTGYLYARQHGYDIAIQMDGDAQHVPSFLPALIAPLKDGTADCVIGSRFVKGSPVTAESFKSSRMRRVGIRFLCGVIRLCSGVRVTDATSGFRAVNRRGIDLFSRRYAKDYPEPENIVRLKKHGLRVREIPVMMRERTAGKSSIDPLKAVYFMIKVTLSIMLVGLEKKAEFDQQ